MLTENRAKDLDLALAACQREKLLLKCRFCPCPSTVVLPLYEVSFEQLDWCPAEANPALLIKLDCWSTNLRVIFSIMLAMSSNKRKAVACERCHAKKIKCLGG